MTALARAVEILKAGGRRDARARRGHRPADEQLERKLAFVFGSPGGETSGQTAFQMLVNLIDFELPVQQAMGHTVEVLPGWGSLGHMQTIRIDQKTGAMTAGGDPRRTGYAMGY